MVLLQISHTPLSLLTPAEVSRRTEIIFLTFKNNTVTPHLAALVWYTHAHTHTHAAHIINSAGQLIDSLRHCLHS